eukprot:COSAG04_NODE_794_length_10264_cov_35.102804_7_plen_39_part_00
MCGWKPVMRAVAAAWGLTWMHSERVSHSTMPLPRICAA